MEERFLPWTSNEILLTRGRMVALLETWQEKVDSRSNLEIMKRVEAVTIADPRSGSIETDTLDRRGLDPLNHRTSGKGRPPLEMHSITTVDFSVKDPPERILNSSIASPSLFPSLSFSIPVSRVVSSELSPLIFAEDPPEVTAEEDNDDDAEVGKEEDEVEWKLKTEFLELLTCFPLTRITGSPGVTVI